MKRASRSWIAALTLGCLVAPGTTATTVSPDGAAVACADRLLASFSAEFGIPGMAAAVRRGDSLVYQRALGDAHVELGVPVTPSTLFQLSSSAKLFTGVLTLRLVEAGRLSLDDRVTDHLPGAPAGWRAVTVRHLLAMIAGLPDVGRVDGALEGARAPEEILGSLYELTPEPEVGVDFIYGGGEFFVLQQIVERVTGEALAEVMREQVFEPAGMLGARYWGSHAEVLPGAATGYYPDGEGGLVQRDFVFPPYLWAAGGLAASAEDLLRFDRALRDGRLLSEESIDAMWTWQPVADDLVVSYGLGWDVKDHAPKQYSAGHSGGYLTTFRHYQTGDLTVVMLTNGFTIDYEYMAPDNLATALAAVWEPAIVGFEARACSFQEIRKAQF